MANKTNTRILVLPFIAKIMSDELLQIESIIVQSIKYKLLLFTSINVVDLRVMSFPSNIKLREDDYDTSDLLITAKKNKSNLALCGKFVICDNTITFKVVNVANSENKEHWNSPVNCLNFSSDIIKSVDIKLFNQLINDSANKVISKLNLSLDNISKDYLNENLINNLSAYNNLIRAKNPNYTKDEKIDHLNKAIKEDPNLYLGMYDLAMLQKSCSMPNEALKNLQQAVNITTNNYIKGYLTSEIAACYLMLNNINKAITSWKTAIELYPKYAKPYINLAILYEENEQFQKSEKCYMDLQNINPNDCRSYINLARIYSKKGEYQKAIEQYNHQLKLTPYDATTYSNIGNCYLQIEKHKEAKNFLNKAVDLDPDGESGIYANQLLTTLEESSKTDWWKFWKL